MTTEVNTHKDFDSEWKPVHRPAAYKYSFPCALSLKGTSDAEMEPSPDNYVLQMVLKDNDGAQED